MVTPEIVLGKSLPPSFCHHLSNSDHHFPCADQKYRVALEVSISFGGALLPTSFLGSAPA